MEAHEQLSKIRAYVDQKAKVWFMENKQKWNAAITVYVDIQEYGDSEEACKTNLTQALFDYKQAREYILARP